MYRLIFTTTNYILISAWWSTYSGYKIHHTYIYIETIIPYLGLYSLQYCAFIAFACKTNAASPGLFGVIKFAIFTLIRRGIWGLGLGLGFITGRVRCQVVRVLRVGVGVRRLGSGLGFGPGFGLGSGFGPGSGSFTGRFRCQVVWVLGVGVQTRIQTRVGVGFRPGLGLGLGFGPGSVTGRWRCEVVWVLVEVPLLSHTRF